MFHHIWAAFRCILTPFMIFQSTLNFEVCTRIWYWCHLGCPGDYWRRSWTFKLIKRPKGWFHWIGVWLSSCANLRDGVRLISHGLGETCMFHRMTRRTWNCTYERISPIGIHYFFHHSWSTSWWSSCRHPFRLDRSSASSRYRRYHLHWRCDRTGSVSWRLEYGKFHTGCHLPLSAWDWWCHGLQVGSRFLIGFGVGLAACIAPLYIQELSPTRLRGTMVVLKYVTLSLSYL